MMKKYHRKVSSFLILCLAGSIVLGMISSSAARSRTTATATKKKGTPSKPVPAKKKGYRPSKRAVSSGEIEKKGYVRIVDSLKDRMCIPEVPFFVALHRCYFQDERLDSGDTLVLRKSALQELLKYATLQISGISLTDGPAAGIDSMAIFKTKSMMADGKTVSCFAVIHAGADSYEIPRTGAKVRVPRVIRCSIQYTAETDRMTVTMATSGVRLELPEYAKIFKSNAFPDRDIQYAELVSSGNAFEGRLLYEAVKKGAPKKGWMFSLTGCNQIAPYQR